MAITVSTVLHLKPEEVDTPEKRAKYTISIIGCSLQGLFFAAIFAEAGFKVICFDADQSTTKRLAKGNVPLIGREIESRLKILVKKGKIIATSELKSSVSKSDIVIITVNTRVDQKRNSDYTEAINYCKQVGANLQKGNLIVYAGIAGLGFVEGILKEILENTSGFKVGEDFGLAYVPFQNSSISNNIAIDDIEIMIAGVTKNSLSAATTIFSFIAKNTPKMTTDIKTAELATLFRATKHNVNVALANELAILCENVGVDYADTLELLTNKFDACATTPTIDEDNQNESCFLLESADNLNIKLRLPALSRQINDEMLKYAINLTQDALRHGEKTMRRAKIGILGTNISGVASKAFIELLESKGAKISRYDPQGNENLLAESNGRVVRRTINDTVEGTDCIVIMSEQEQFRKLNFKKLKAIMKSPAAIVDLSGTIEPSKALKEGFIYRGLGRGAWKN